jgi:hypothetical protein
VEDQDAESAEDSIAELNELKKGKPSPVQSQKKKSENEEPQQKEQDQKESPQPKKPKAKLREGQSQNQKAEQASLFEEKSKPQKEIQKARANGKIKKKIEGKAFGVGETIELDL